MAPLITPVQTSLDLPEATTVVVIGGGIIGLVAALVLAERGTPVVVLEKGRIAGEQSSRNQGWIRKMSRSAPDVPLAMAADPLWNGLAARVGADVGYRRAGILYLARNESELAVHQDWLDSVQDLALDSRQISALRIGLLAPGGRGHWAGGLYTPSDGRAEPTLAASAIARAAMAKGAVIVEHCAVRTLSLAAGRIAGVVSERGEIRCEQVLLAGGLWSRRFLGNQGIDLPTLPLVASILRTAPVQGPCDITVGAPDFSFRKRLDGGFTISHRGVLNAPLTLDSLLLGRRYLGALREQWQNLQPSIGRELFDDLLLGRRWRADQVSPFERVRTLDPPADPRVNAEALRNLATAWPMFKDVVVKQAWSGALDVTPDSLPVIGPVAKIPGLTLASGFSGHGFGTAPAAGQLAADLICATRPIVDPRPYRLERF
ncbi:MULTISPECIES: FAD-binding oxidoreductase [unclassified Pseudomonas]|uniref:NAD(P)/FAD-dependent oxidoreductase n=1 Tax=unclassified Pseudomonas TaxID=196821 RepID=UPI0008381E26|nr:MULTISPECIES: FAD-binding oxidoreductase [unclassified Pseudomonas]QIH08515.1 FAD-binding oxidoreductase [Pseudomonas sp. BIOMIG1BAC]